MSLVEYKPDDHATGGNILTLLVPTIADINKPTVAELSSGFSIDAAIESFELSTDAKTESRKKLSDKVSTETIGERTYKTGDTDILSDDPQTVHAIEALLEPDTYVYMVMRPGKERSAPIAAGDRVWVNRQQVVSRDATEVNTDAGNNFGWKITWATKARTYNGKVQA